MSSHREAPGISKDPVADNTDTYAFVSPDRPGWVTIITNYVPSEGPAGGPNFYEFGDDVRYDISIDNDGDGDADITYQFRFTTLIKNPDTFLYNTGQLLTIDSASWTRPQFYSVTRVHGEGGDRRPHVLASNLACPPCNIGPRSTPSSAYATIARNAVHDLGGGRKVFAGQRRDGFYVDLGSIFDLGALRPIQSLHLINMPGNTAGVNTLKGANVHSIAIQIPISDLTRDGSTPSNYKDPRAVIGVWGSAWRQRISIRENERSHFAGPWTQVSRLGMPLVNEVIIPMAKKDYWNTQRPQSDSQFASYYANPELGGLIPFLYPGKFPHLAALAASKASRADLLAILLTGVPDGLFAGFQNYTGTTQADMLRLNMAIPPTVSNPNPGGVVFGDNAGFPNGRRVFDDVVTVELRAIAGAVYGKVATFTADAAVGAITDGLDMTSTSYLNPVGFPYLGVPLDGYDHPAV